MKIAGIVAEYNPFHLGHRYQTDWLRERGYEGIVAVMSGNFVQRADTALTDKYRRAEGAVRSGIDLVLELPLPYAVAAAEDFARGGIGILNATGVVDTVCCGCESGEEINRAQYEGLKAAEEDGTVREHMKAGLSYPAACRKSVTDKGGHWSDEPNDVLALAYRKALEGSASPMDLLTLKRKGSYHGSDGYEGAESIRRRLSLGEDVSGALPEGSYEAIRGGDISDLGRLERGILAYYRTVKPEELKGYYGMREGLPERICKYASQASLEALYDKVKTKRFPHSAVRRAVLCGYLNLPKDLPEITYLRVLAFNEKGQEILREMKKRSTLPICPILKPEQRADPLAEAQLRGDEVFALTLQTPSAPLRDLTESARKIGKL